MAISNNLFTYATSELSQDAFICWLLSHLYPENHGIDIAIESCAIEFVKRFYKDFSGEASQFSIKRQYKNIDILVCIDEKEIIIEDKTFTNTHDDQVNRYKKTLLDEGTLESNIICVFYKIIEQPCKEQNVDYEFTRKELISIFEKYTKKTDNRIFIDYFEYLKNIDDQVSSYCNKSIDKWSHWEYIGFFTMLQNSFLKDKDNSWSYVNNPSGGFSCLWWFKDDWNDLLELSGLRQKGICSFYPQLEGNCIAIKIQADSNATNVSDVRWQLYSYFAEKIPEFKKKTFKRGKHMTVGFVEYTFENYKQVFEMVEKAIDELRLLSF